MKALEHIIKAWEDSTPNNNEFAKLIYSIKWDKIFLENEEHCYCITRKNTTIILMAEHLNPFNRYTLHTPVITFYNKYGEREIGHIFKIKKAKSHV